jgi:hypothetical protein
MGDRGALTPRAGDRPRSPRFPQVATGGAFDGWRGAWNPGCVGRRHAFALALACVVAAAVAAAAFAAGGYTGSARGVVLTAAQAKYRALTLSSPAPKPAADKRRGYRSGWEASYFKGSAAIPVTAFSLVYVYATPADARRAFDRSCASCSSRVKVGGVDMKFQLTAQKTTPAVVDVASCRNVYVAVLVTGKIGTKALAQAAGELAGGVYAKAMANGMASCAKA